MGYQSSSTYSVVKVLSYIIPYFLSACLGCLILLETIKRLTARANNIHLTHKIRPQLFITFLTAQFHYIFITKVYGLKHLSILVLQSGHKTSISLLYSNWGLTNSSFLAHFGHLYSYIGISIYLSYVLVTSFLKCWHIPLIAFRS